MAEAACRIAGLCRGQQQHISQVAYAGTAQVSMAEAKNGRVGVVVARTPVPAFDTLRRSELYHAEWHIGSYKYMAVATAAYHGVDIGGKRFLLLCLVCASACQQQRHQKYRAQTVFFHSAKLQKSAYCTKYYGLI